MIRGYFFCVYKYIYIYTRIQYRFPFDKDTRSDWEEVGRYATFTFTEITRTHTRLRYTCVWSCEDKYIKIIRFLFFFLFNPFIFVRVRIEHEARVDPLSLFEALFFSPSSHRFTRFSVPFFFSFFSREIRLRPELFRPLTEP